LCSHVRLQGSGYNARVNNKPAQQMSCMEVWGGSQLTDSRVEFGGLEAWVYSKPYGQAHRGGDVYYASSCATGRITRLLLADVAGHGASVAATAADLRLLMRRFVNCLDQTELVRSINRQFGELSRQAVFATVVVTTFFSPTRRLTVCNAGHPRPLIYRTAQRQWDFLHDKEHGTPPGPRNLPLGILSISDYDQFDVELEVGDYIMSYTDALIESQDADGEMLGEDGLLRIIRLLGGVDAPQLIPVLLQEILGRYPENLSNDDVTVMLVRTTSRLPRYSLGEKIGALLRLFGAAIRAINPSAERPPLPDFNLANIGGAIIPALGRRWRAVTATRHK
jgi:sigma-B regulation protein RsbU (phosphoserine phosphatase)